MIDNYDKHIQEVKKMLNKKYEEYQNNDKKKITFLDVPIECLNTREEFLGLLYFLKEKQFLQII